MFRIYNTLTRQKEVFRAIKDGEISMYVCGVTVYDSCHIGHARAIVVFDVIYRYLKYLGYKVKYVRNFTDIDDKIINKATSEGISTHEVAERYIKEFYNDIYPLGIERPTYEPKATDHIQDMIDMIKILVDNGYAYEVGREVFYSVSKFEGYGRLSGKKIDELLAGARIEVDEHKRDPLDFALWKESKPEEPAWESPWGMGRPGWHIECSAMSHKYLGKRFDIHGGGRDLIFPHHENEIAQSEGVTGERSVNYWIHNGFVNINKEKMSKSLGNFFTVREVLERYHPEVLRLFLISSHYRSPIDFSDYNLKEANKVLNRFYDILWFAKTTNKGADSTKRDYHEMNNDLMKRFEDAMNDDFNTARVIGYLNDLLRDLNRLRERIPNSTHKEKREILIEINKGVEDLKRVGDVIGLFGVDPDGYIKGQRLERIKELGIEETEINRLIEDRSNARQRKDWDTADNIRSDLTRRGIVLEDTKEGTLWKIKD
ncbi:MAG: cysteine--tRNA ligase [Nitrospinae bacterium]|nr:cysteine--tRNA ligase [Nitrospinota bacterium]